MCGIIGINSNQNISSEIIHGLTAMQHRGQDSAGIVTFDGNFKIKKGAGQVSSVFHNVDMDKLKGNCGLGHVRYATIGSTEAIDAQPFSVNYPFGLAMVHNGNVINFNSLRKKLNREKRLIDTSNDVELILYAFAASLEKKDIHKISVDDIFETVEEVQNSVKGAYSVLTIIANQGFLAFTDSHGIRPLIMAKKETENGLTYAFASETSVFDYLGYEVMRDLEAGEAVYIDKDNKIHSKILKQEKKAFCVFEYIYFAREDSIFHNRLVASERVKMGKRLSENLEKSGVKPDIIIDVPNSAYFFASGLAEKVGIPYRRGLAKNRFIGRSFITPNQKERESVVKQKLNPIKDIVKNHKIAVVDDSIVRGTTSRHLINLLKKYGAKEVYFISASPPVKYPCIYGIDMSVKKEMIASDKNNSQIAKSLNAESVIYQSLEDLQDMYSDLPICDACFSGNYPTGISEDVLEQIEAEKLKSNRV
ncbi:MAG: amidophosphoribosyltransferase [Candidatus Marinimicrobia bacterium]|nr:amidophosphoribosyltransferase [Candidatus Neomarinimicrobiota bacterium]